MLIFDEGSFPFDYLIVEEAERYNIAIYFLPSNTSHELQLLGKSVHKLFASHWDQKLVTFMYQNPDRRLKKTSFDRIFISLAKSLTHEEVS